MTSKLKGNEPQLPAAYVSQITKSVNSALKQTGIKSQNGDKTPGGGPPSNSNKKKCKNCKRKGHTKNQCRQKGGGAYKPGLLTLPKWLFEKPSRDVLKAKMEKNGKTDFWCTKCSPNCWRYYSTDKHDEWVKKRKDADQSNKAKQKAEKAAKRVTFQEEKEYANIASAEVDSAMAYQPLTDDDDEDFINFDGFQRVTLT